MATKLLAFHGDVKLKEDMVAEVKWHQEQDKIIQGTYGDKGKYCAVGCSINSLNRKRGKDYGTGNHQVYEDELGIPRAIAHLEDRIFEGLDSEEAKKFPLRFMEAIKPGADLSLVTARFMVWLLVDRNYGVIQFAREDGVVAIKQVVKLYRRIIAGKSVSNQEWLDAAYAADAAAYAADAAAYAAARAADAAYAAAYAADAAAYAAARAADAAYAAAYAAYAAAYAADAAAYAAAYAADAAAYKRMANKLIKLLAEAE